MERGFNEDGIIAESSKNNNSSSVLEDIDDSGSMFNDTMENVDDETNAQLSNIFGHQRIKSEFDLSSDTPTNALLRRTLMETDEMSSNHHHHLNSISNNSSSHHNNIDPLQDVAAMFSVGQGMTNLGSNIAMGSMNSVNNHHSGGGHRSEMNYQIRSHHLVRPNNPLGLRRRAPRGSRMGPQSYVSLKF